MFHLFSLLTILYINGLYCQNCTQTQAYWGQNNTWPNTINDTTLCHTQWRDIMAIDTMRMTIPSNQYWVVASHQYITARLNMEIMSSSSVEVDNAILWLGDSLERACANLSGWASEDIHHSVYNAIEVLRKYSYQYECQVNDTGMIDALYFLHTPDLLVIPENFTLGFNKTFISSLLGETYRQREYTLSGTVLGCLVIIPILCLVICLLSNYRRKYYLKKKKTRKV